MNREEMQQLLAEAIVAGVTRAPQTASAPVARR